MITRYVIFDNPNDNTNSQLNKRYPRIDWRQRRLLSDMPIYEERQGDRLTIREFTSVYRLILRMFPRGWRITDEIKLSIMNSTIVVRIDE